MARVNFLFDEPDGPQYPPGTVQDADTDEIRQIRPDDIYWEDDEYMNPAGGKYVNAMEFLSRPAGARPVEALRDMYSRSMLPQTGVSFEQYLHGSGFTEAAPGWWKQTGVGRDWGLGDRAGFGDFLKVAVPTFLAAAGVSGMPLDFGLSNLLGGGEAALAGAGGGGAAEIASLAELPGFGGVGEIGAVASGATTFPLETLPMPQGTPLPPVDGVSNLPMPPGTPPPAPVDIPAPTSGLPSMSPTPPLPGQTGPTLPTIPGGTGTVIDGVPPVATGGAAAGGFSSFLKDVLGISNEANIPRSLIDLLGGVYSAYSQNQTAGDYENFTKSYLDRAFPQATTDEQIGWAGVSKDMRTNGDFWKNNSLMNQLGQTAANKAERQAAAQGYNLSSNALQSMYRDSYDAMASKFALPYMEQVSRNAGLQKASPDAFASSMASNIYKNDQQTQGTIGNVIKTGVNTVLGKP